MLNKKFLILILVLLALAFFGWQILQKKTGGIYIPIEERGDGDSKVVGGVVPGLSPPEGFQITFFAKDLPGARVMEFDPKGRMLVTQTKEGIISLLSDEDSDGLAEKKKTLISGLKNPHGMAWQCPSDGKTCFLYVALSDKLLRYDYDANLGAVSNETKLIDISYSSFDNHFTRSLLFLPPPDENILLISVGSSCNVCEEDDADQINGHAKILSYDLKTGKLEEYAKGLRNAVFMTLDPIFGKVFATEMGRDLLGDDIPPDEINIIEKGKNYGWPTCYGKNIHDDSFDKNTYIRNPCMEPFETPSFVDLQAHSAPLGLSFVPEEGWPPEYWYNLLVAYHGSWNRSVPTGYKIARIKLDAKGKYLGTEDFITGWLTRDNNKIGRPVDIKIFSGGTAFITDDLLGVVYKLSRTGNDL
ncbi:hypothetical protein A2914_00330 [Candidatus Nomurabacteria bacterium RIFCSPLOWO2_01_FULL_41_21]|uniref:Pyrroloquinoline quinone-dependent pyranose dehydrogenase beta-propeller domain-containing protein n=2 Tax=Candidatus Nomuraibacteriota TaxID=1752729 RepID=A0A1F6V3N0_9BACT|nr:MAG: hypothetical protein A2733_02735 [Candidatus Nomurabacteria bacterium RIFCSPHIGHO2_01_FULL_40_20]OGI88801.1 MAG: hypothetical protein A2914_00330 [Candidatus Nomurabacteria bacterium RIFCSPLOWO2_01_FULL_41_21]